uniref:Fe2OG dioxygenase domain-containing protein n=1 Tax=Alexandrium catenella TaxID=2925 RepID=A0A7S1WBP9_ALECA
MAPPSAKWEYPLADEGWRCFLGYLPGAIGGPDSASFFKQVLEGTSWLQPKGRWGPLPLRTAWMAQAPCVCTYGYGGAQVLPVPYPEWMHALMARCMPLCGLPEEATWPDSCNLNLYKDGQHSVGWHADNEALFQGKARDCRIISLSLGETRQFEIKCKGGGFQKLRLNDGDLCTMEGLTQKHYQHRVPKDFARKVGERINLTWRWVVEHAAGCSLSAAGAAPLAA